MKYLIEEEKLIKGIIKKEIKEEIEINFNERDITIIKENKEIMKLININFISIGEKISFFDFFIKGEENNKVYVCNIEDIIKWLKNRIEREEIKKEITQ